MNRIYYRYTYLGQGVYEALKNVISSDEWKQLKDSIAFKWLPCPSTYNTSKHLCTSFFTEFGNERFKKLTLPIISDILGKDSIKCEKSNLSDLSIVYKDPYQVVTINENKEITIQKFLNENNIRNYTDLYAWMCENISYTNDDVSDDQSIVQGTIQLMDSKCGHCYETSNFEYDMLSALGYSCSIIFCAELKNIKNYTTTHSFVIFKDKTGKIVWFEISWDKMRGIHKADSIIDILNTIYKNWNFSDYDRLYFFNDFPQSGMSIIEYSDNIIKNQQPIKKYRRVSLYDSERRFHFV